MRQADDLSDDETISIEERRKRLDAWLGEWREVCANPNFEIASADPVFIAVRDATERFQIPLALLDELVAGVTMDLNHAASNSAPDTYATFADLYRYCYLVASVVGLVCIRIFGYQDPRAEKLAEETGIAFQLTNILRDVAEDAERNRVYLPLEDLAAHKVSLDSLLHRKAGSAANRKRARAAQGNRPACGGLLPVGASLNAADRQGKPSGALGAGHHLSCSAETNRARRLRCVFPPSQCADGREAGNSSCRPGANELGADGWII